MRLTIKEKLQEMVDWANVSDEDYNFYIKRRNEANAMWLRLVGEYPHLGGWAFEELCERYKISR